MKTCILVLALSAGAFAQTVTLQTQVKGAFTRTHDLLLRAAEKMPADQYGFKPTPDVRSFGAIVGHVVETNYFFCSTAKGVENPGKGIETNKTAKADLVQAVQDVKSFCEPAFEGLTADKIVKNGQREVPALGMLFNMNGHTWEHYGNIATYMRLKGIVPPSSEK